ncbi:MAG: hypothetical protein ACJAS4_002517 [Bacteriovoracaceae bacterium]|jgi:hypothetical protein
MKKFIFMTLFFVNLAIAYSETNNHVPQFAEEQGPDIPLVGSSMFDKIFSETNSHGETLHELPFPIGKLMGKISIKNSVVHTMLPFSRSLQRPSSTSYDPLLNPRLVFSSKHSSTWLERAKIFIGYVREMDQLEVISYNDEAGRFEYQLVKDYSTKPKIFYVNRGKCLSCHQGQAPIFSVPGWQDTNSGVLGELIAAKLGMKEGSTLQSKVTMADKLYGGLPSLDAVGNFDALVRESNEISLDERVWNVGCGKNNECRLGLLLSTLAGNSESSTKYMAIARKEIKLSPLATQNLYSSFLPSTELGALKVIRKYERTGNGNSYQNTALNSQAVQEIVANIYKLSGSKNPANRRLRAFSDDTLIPRSLTGFTFKDEQIIEKEVKDIEQALLTLYKEGHEIFEQSSINKPKIMFTILERENSLFAKTYKKFLDKKTARKVLFSGAIMPVFKQPELNVFARYCHECHASGLAFPPQFLLGTEEEVMEKIDRFSTKIHFKLTSKLMPPNKKERDLLHSSGDVEILLEYIKQFKK